MTKEKNQPAFSVVAHNERVVRLIRKFDNRLRAAHSERMEIIDREDRGEKLCFADAARCSDLYLEIADLSRTIDQLGSLILPSRHTHTTPSSEKGFKDGTCIRVNSAGEHFPVTYHSVGGIPNGDGRSFWVIQHPCGTKRRSWTAEKRDECIASFVEADKAIKGLDLQVVSERTAFELALASLEGEGSWIGFSMSEGQQ